MDQLAEIRLDEAALKEITHLEVSRYAATSLTDTFYPVLDDTNKIYAVIIVPGNAEDRPSWAFVLARVIDDYIVIEEDGPPDKTLSEALMSTVVSRAKKSSSHTRVKRYHLNNPKKSSMLA